MVTLHAYLFTLANKKKKEQRLLPNFTKREGASKWLTQLGNAGKSAGVTHLGEVPAARHHVKPELGHEGPCHLLISSPLQAKGNQKDDNPPAPLGPALGAQRSSEA